MKGHLATRIGMIAYGRCCTARPHPDDGPADQQPREEPRRGCVGGGASLSSRGPSHRLRIRQRSRSSAESANVIVILSAASPAPGPRGSHI